MTIIRIIQEKSIVHTEFNLLDDYRVYPAENLALAKAWASMGLLDRASVALINLIENLQNYFTALRNLQEIKSGVTSREVDDYVRKLETHCRPSDVDAVVGG